MNSLLFFTLGWVSNNLFQGELEKEKEIRKIQSENTKSKMKRHRFKHSFTKTFKITSDKPQKINPEDIKVQIRTKEPENKVQKNNEPNPVALAVFWAYYKAYKEGLLEKNKPAPWEKINPEYIKGKQKQEVLQWRNFLSKLVQNESWTEWIKKPEEVKLRVINAYNKTDQK